MIEFIKQYLLYIWIGIGVISCLLGVVFMLTKKRFFFAFEFGIILVLAFVFYNGKPDSPISFMTVLLIGFTSLASFGAGFGIIYLIKRFLGTNKNKVEQS